MSEIDANNSLSEAEAKAKAERREKIIAMSKANLALIPSMAKTAEDFKNVVFKAIESSWEDYTRPAGFSELSRKYNRAAKHFGGLSNIIQELCDEGRTITLTTHKKAAVLLTLEQYEAILDSNPDSVSEVLENLFKAYHFKG